MVAAVIVAAGKGSRMGGALPKQVQPLAGRPMVEHALRAFQRSEAVDRMVLVLPAGLRTIVPLKLGPFHKLQAVVDGGETRQDSVRRGLEAVPEAEWVLIHDGARPLVTPSLIAAVLQAARECGAAVPASPARETLKRVRDGRVVETLDRTDVFQVQTPQGFRAELLRRAHEAAGPEGFVGTDDAQLVERLGEPVARVPAPSFNLKVTGPADLKLAELLLRAGAAAWEA